MTKTSTVSLIIGFVLAAILIGVSYDLVANRVIVDAAKLSTWVCVLAVVTFLIEAICFFGLHVRNAEGKLDVYTFLFTILVALIVIIGSLWIMYNLNYNMVVH